MTKKIRIIRTIIYAAMIAALLLIAFQYTNLPKGAESISILADGEPAGEEITLSVGDDIFLSAVIEPEEFADRTVNWESSEEAVASIDGEETLKALKEGSATITAEAAGCSAKIVINVEKEDDVESIEGFETDVTMDVGYSYTIEPVITMKSGGQTAPKPVYESDDESVVTVDEDGVITAVGSGMANVTVTAGSKSVKIITRVR